MKKLLLSAGILASLMATSPVSAQSLLDYVGQCVPFARAASGIQIYGDAWTWWEKAEGHYQRGDVPRVGAVVVFARTQRLPLGHVAVISRVVDDRVVMVTHANWSRVGGERGHAEQDVTLTDTSPDNDWSSVRVWYRDMGGLGSTTYPVSGFIYGTPATRSAPRARPARELTSRDPDYVGALLDVYR
ncbi:CHAP domain-containing protein [Sphingomonas immobilis]|jgi:surface antigen|uniref:CHAP domain-containing protein n=1 Tax=Sphingomonas immobilis TaxID=3063997 RepID=A0ABT8ZUC1_9SPHN|nr:CHAP domain-containing protein [Sphingomonas sp. CA1-15]MDO7841171.1 CHAP domain-containing protein [Sphingomonas sp. CA1-15]